MWFNFGGENMKRLPLFALLAITSILFFGLRQSAEVVGDKLYIQRQKLRDALYGKSGFKGLSGTLTCSPRATAPSQTSKYSGLPATSVNQTSNNHRTVFG